MLEIMENIVSSVLSVIVDWRILNLTNKNNVCKTMKQTNELL